MVRIVIELEHVLDVHVLVHEFLITLYFHVFVPVVVINVMHYVLVVFVTKNQYDIIFLNLRILLLCLI
jgi:hypothetical protein